MTKSAIVAAIALLLLAAVARAESETVTSGNTTATLTWTPAEIGVTGATLTITREGAAAFSKLIPDVVCDPCNEEQSRHGTVRRASAARPTAAPAGWTRC